MPKNVVVCCDGTANEFAKDLTNVVKLFSTLVQDPERQVAFYHPGLGTMEPPGALTPWTRRVARLLAQAFGHGLEAEIQNAYLFLMYNFEPGDKVFLFGFSRGAYTVRALASLLRMYGLIRRGNETLVPYAVRLLIAVDKAERHQTRVRDDRRGVFDLATAFRATFSSTECRPWFVGLWDTVSSIGWYDNQLKLPFTAQNPDIQIGRHAIAIDERRAFFRTNLWMPKPQPPDTGPKNLRQVWFAGVHSDVGGGYPEAESGLSKIPLAWMLGEAATAGILVDPQKVDLVLGRAGADHLAPSPSAPMHDSLTGLWWLVEFLPKRHFNWRLGRWERRMNLARPRTIPPGSMIHRSAYERGPEYSRKFPTDAKPVD